MKNQKMLRATITAFALCLATALPAQAATTEESVAEITAEQVQAASPDDATVLAPAVTTGGELSANNGAVTIPADGSGTIEMSLQDATDAALEFPGSTVSSPAMTLTLPAEADASGAAAQVADDGTVVYSGDDSVNVAVQAVVSGLRVQTISSEASAPTEYTYSFGGDVVPYLLPDGSVELATDLGSGLTMSVGRIDLPWAVDAHGNAVPTSYRVVGSDVIQVVEHNVRGIAYPVVADPNILWTRSYANFYARFNRAYTNNLMYGTGLGTIVATLVAASLGTLAPVAVVLGARLALDTVVANWYYNRGNCFGYRIFAPQILNPPAWQPIEVTRGTFNCQ